MGIKVRCYLDGVIKEEPINLRDLELSIVRDEQLHGIGFEASTLALNFIGDAYDYIEERYVEEGLKANIIFKAEQNCGDDPDGWDTIIEGRLNMSQRKKNCGNSCMVSIPIESISCEMTLKNRFDQNVDIDKTIGFDGLTALPSYFGLGLDMELPTKELDYKTEGYVADEGDEEDIHFGSGPAAVIFVRPDFKNEIATNIIQSELTGASTTGYIDNDIFLPVSPEVLFDEPNVNCFPRSFKINGRLKGTINLTQNVGDGQVHIGGRLRIGEIRNAFPYTDIDQDKESTNIFDGHISGHISFDWTLTEYDWSPSRPGSEGVYFMLVVEIENGVVIDGNITFDKESFIIIETIKACPPTNTKAYLVHETLSRITEAITDYCVRVKSEYYGRRDSEPFDFPNDGCGGLRMLTSGLKIRNAANPTFFTSLQTLIEGLQDIDNIGMGIEQDPDRPNQLLLRVEGLDFFYRNQELLRCDGIIDGQEAIDITKTYSAINVGYKKWETQANFGLDEFNGNRQYRTALTAVSTILDLTSLLVAGEYPIELTRQQQYVETSEADTTYDNETFIICLRRMAAAGYPYGELVVDQGNINDAENVFSPSSIYNYAISPIRNLMRWFRSIAAGYPNIVDTDNRLYFNSGVGNILAKGLQTGDGCIMENQSIAENQDISPVLFLDQAKAKPLWRNEPFNYGYPLSLKQYKDIKANPYGYISYQCGNGEWKKGWISEIAYKPFDGMALFKLRKTWE